jgi:dihydrolipoamide dehydrogenase
LSLKESASGVVMQVRKNDDASEMRAECALLCTGRKPLLYPAELERLGINYDQAGIKVNAKMMTHVPGVYAVGDVTGGMMLAHRASRQAKIAVESMFGGGHSIYNEDSIPSVVYSHPQIARVGYTQKRAEEEGLSVDVMKSQYSANIIARAELLGPGFVKAVFHQDQIIGATIVGDHAGDLIAPLALAVSNKITMNQLRRWVIPHPTLSEIFIPLIGS